jgi:hypothetical protein
MLCNYSLAEIGPTTGSDVEVVRLVVLVAMQADVPVSISVVVMLVVVLVTVLRVVGVVIGVVLGTPQADVSSSPPVVVLRTGLVVVPGVVPVVVPPVRSGQMALPARRAVGYSTLGRPLSSVTVMPPLPSVV